MDTPAGPATDAEVLLAGYPSVISLPIQWGEQDLYAHVNNTVYFRWFESGRVAYGEQIGLPDLLITRGIGPILAALSCNYRRQLTYPDTVQIGTRVTAIGRTSMKMSHLVVSPKWPVAAADGESVVVAFDYRAGHSVPVPPTLIEAIERLEGKSFRPPAGGTLRG